jgi:PilZ domain-containing protein
MIHFQERQPVPLATINRRRDARIPGPFDAWRVGMIDTPLRIFDLSVGGCFVDAMHEQPPGTRLTIKVALPRIGTLTVRGETLYERNGFGFAVRFVDVDAETMSLLNDALDLLQRDPASV